MTIGERQVLQGPAEDLSDLLSEVRHADVLANDPCTREFLQAGERLLHDILARDAEETPGRARVPFDELLACVSRRQVVDEAERSWTGQGEKAGGPTSPHSGTAGIRRPDFFAISLFIRCGHAWRLPVSPEMPPVCCSGRRRAPGSALSMRKSIKLHTTRS